MRSSPSSLVRMSVLLLVGMLAGPAPRAARAADVLLTGYTLTLKDHAIYARKRALMLSSKDEQIAPIPSLTTDGATLRVVGATFDATYQLPSGSWAIGTGGRLRYRDTHTVNGPIRTVDMLPTRLRIGGKGELLLHSLATSPEPVSIVFTTGTTRYCFEFGGTIKFRLEKLFTARGSAAPAACAN
jgi:hypothetical protein